MSKGGTAREKIMGQNRNMWTWEEIRRIYESWRDPDHDGEQVM